MKEHFSIFNEFPPKLSLNQQGDIMSHTQEWTVEERVNHYVIIDKGQPHASPVAGEMTEPTAKRIVQMNNSFDELLNASQGAILALQTYANEGMKVHFAFDAMRPLQEAYNKAIAQAEE